MYLRQQNAIRHQFNTGVRRYLVMKAHFVTDRPTQFCFQFDRNACRTDRAATRRG